MKRYSRFPLLLQSSWQVVSTIAIIGAVLALLLFARLDSVLPGYSATEVATAKASQSIGTILDNPVNAPYKIVAFGISNLIDPLPATRVTAAIFGSLTILLFYFGVRNWHSARISFLATLLFATSAWFLHAARFGSPDIMLPLSVLFLAAAGFWIASHPNSTIGYAAAMIALALSLFVPGMIWFVLAALFVRKGKDFRAVTRNFSTLQIVGLILFFFVAVAGPITLALVNQPDVATRLLGLPTTWPDPFTALKNLALIPVSLFFVSNASPEIWLSNLPYLDIFSSVAFVLGIYYFFKFRSLDRAKLLAMFLVFASVLVALGGVRDTLLLPGVYIAIGGGIALLLTQWLTVFPRNPLAQYIGIILISIAVGFSAIYNLRAYFVAWPNNQDTKGAYSLSSKDLIQ